MPDSRREILQEVAATALLRKFIYNPSPGGPISPRAPRSGVATIGAETDWTRIQYTMIPSEAGVRATVTVEDKRGTVRAYAYFIKGTSVQPVDVTMDVNAARNMAQ